VVHKLFSIYILNNIYSQLYISHFSVPETMLIEGKVALITGGAGGVGKAFATALLKAKIAAVSS